MEDNTNNIKTCSFFYVLFVNVLLSHQPSKLIYLSSLRRLSCAFAGGNAPVTKVTKEIFSHLSISQQFFKALTELSLVLIADEERACNVASFV